MKEHCFLSPDPPLGSAEGLQLIADLLALVDVHIAPEALAPLSELELLVVYDWACREHLVAAGNRIRRRDKPALLDLLTGADLPEYCQVATPRCHVGPRHPGRHGCPALDAACEGREALEPPRHLFERSCSIWNLVCNGKVRNRRSTCRKRGGT